MAGAGFPRRGGRRRGLALVVLLSLTLAACGGEEEADDGENEFDAGGEPTAVRSILDASPEALASPSTVDLPQDAGTATVAIRDGALEPDTIEGQIGQPFILTVEGDGAEHTLAIEGLVDEEPIAAEGETLVQFTVEGEAGDKAILLDGEEAGTFRAQAAGGLTDS